MAVVGAIGGATVIDDTYNANPAGAANMQATIDRYGPYR